MSTDVAVLTYARNPLELTPEIRLYLDRSGSLHRVSVLELSKTEGAIVSYELANVATAIRLAGGTPPPKLIDVLDAVALANGRPAAQDPPHSIWRHIRLRTDAGAQLFEVSRGLVGAALQQTEELRLIRIMSSAVRELWERARHELIERGEWSRFESVEIPVTQVLLHASVRGVAFDRQQVSVRLGQLSDRIARAATLLRQNWGVLSASDPAQLARAITMDGDPALAQVLRKPLLPPLIRANLDAVLDFLPEQHEIAEQIREFRAATHDKSVLLHLSVLDSDRTFPRYVNVGTVTARIMVRRPSLQYLSKKARALLRPTDGFVFAYADFAQFEPGILADESKDPALIEDYNTGDVYAALSRHVFGTESFRDHAKIVFIAFCYGMSVQRAGDMLKVNAGCPDDVDTLLESFFDRYRRLEEWRAARHEEFERTGRMSSRLGNFRYRQTNGSVRASEQRACISQRIQGTAALILKRAIIRVAAGGPSRMVLPMHDAVLYEVPTAHEKQERERIAGVFCDVFKSECPAIVPKVVFREFAVEE